MFDIKKMLSSYFSNIRRTRFDQSSPVHPVSESRGGTLRVTEEQEQQEQQQEGTSTFEYRIFRAVLSTKYLPCSTSSQVLFFLQNIRITFDLYWCINIFYYPTFRIHKIVCKDIRYRLVSKLNLLFKIIRKMDRRKKQNFFILHFE